MKINVDEIYFTVDVALIPHYKHQQMILWKFNSLHPD